MCTQSSSPCKETLVITQRPLNRGYIGSNIFFQLTVPYVSMNSIVYAYRSTITGEQLTSNLIKFLNCNLQDLCTIKDNLWALANKKITKEVRTNARYEPSSV
jgi:hypothetical protein